MKKKLLNLFNNQSLHFKMISLFLLMVIIMQFFTGIVTARIVENELEKDLIKSNMSALDQMTANLDEILMNIVEGLYPIQSLAKNVQLSASAKPYSKAYVNDNVAYQALYSQLISSRNNYKFISSMLVLGSDGTIHSFVYNGFIRINNENLFHKVLQDCGDRSKYYWTTVRSDAYFFDEPREDIFSIIVPIRFYKTTKGFVVLNISVKKMQAYLDLMSDENNGLFLQIATDTNISSGKIADALLANKKYNSVLADIHRTPVQEMGDTILLTLRLTVNNWNVSMVYNRNNQGTSSGILMRLIIPIFFCAGLFLIVSGGFIVFLVTKPIRKLTGIMVENGSNPAMSRRFHAKYSDEVGVLGTTYNQMMDDIKSEQEKNKLAYMKMLQMQIKPHFLYNSMESARFLVEMKDSKAVDMIRAIVRFYKLTLSGVNDYVRISEEIEHISCYLQILQIRYSSKYDYAIDIEPSILNDMIEKFTLQPLVENAIYHGIKMKRQKGYINITGHKEDGKIKIKIYDNGMGISGEKLEEIRARLLDTRQSSPSEHIGIINVHQRLRLHYGVEYGLDVQSEYEKFTQITIFIPAIKYDNSMNSEEAQDDQAANC